MKKNVYIETHGCQMNVADTERAATRLRAAGYTLVGSADSADVLLFNTCSVRAKAQQKVFNRIRALRQQLNGGQPLVGLMGCVAQLEGESLFDHTQRIDLLVGTRATDRLPSLIERAQNGQRRIFDLGERGEADSWDVSTVERHHSQVAFVPIIEGCNKFCSYCIVPFSRGRERSRTALEILAEIESLRLEGFREVHLIGQNVNSYRPRSSDGLDGVEGATPFSKLLRAVAATGMERIKFTTSFPRDFHADIVAAINEHQNLCDWVHLPVQSGSDRVLRAMRRGYTVSDYLRKVDAVKNSVRRLALTSDVIVGYPGETLEEFEDTMRLVEHCQYDGLYIFKYSERPDTPAAALKDDVSEQEKTARFMTVEKLQREIQSRIYDGYRGREVEVLVEGESAKSAQDMTGHTTCQKVVNFPGGSDLKGHIQRVRIDKAKTNSLYGHRSADLSEA